MLGSHGCPTLFVSFLWLHVHVRICWLVVYVVYGVFVSGWLSLVICRVASACLVFRCQVVTAGEPVCVHGCVFVHLNVLLLTSQFAYQCQRAGVHRPIEPGNHRPIERAPLVPRLLPPHSIPQSSP